jgi:hypothetical protein
LYEVEIADADVLHRGDWSWLQIIRNALQTNAAQAEGGADIYWSGLATETPVWELLARNVKVLREINIPIQERLGLRAKAVGLPVLGQVPDGQ